MALGARCLAVGMISAIALASRLAVRLKPSVRSPSGSTSVSLHNWMLCEQWFGDSALTLPGIRAWKRTWS